MGPAFDVAVGADEFADLAGEGVLIEELDVVAAGVGLVHAGADDGAEVEAGHVLGYVFRGPAFFGQGDVEVGLGRVGLERAGRVHGGEGGGAQEGRRLFEGGLDVRGDSDDVVGADVGDEGVEGQSGRSREACPGRGGWWLGSARTSVGVFGGVDLFRYAGELGFDFCAGRRRRSRGGDRGGVDHLVVGEFFAEGVGAEAVVAVGAGEEIGLHPCAVGFEGVDDGGVGFGEVGFGGGVGCGGEGGGDVFLEEADEAVDLFEGYFGVDVGRVFEVFAGFCEDLWN